MHTMTNLMRKKRLMTIFELKAHALATKIPIITDQALDYITTYIKTNHVKNILEIGGAIGYSAIAFSLLGCHVDTFERDDIRALEAQTWITDFGADVTLYHTDALLFDASTLKNYDLIFIDAAKAQYQKFFEKYEKNLNPQGVMICDNINFHHLNPEEVSRNTRALLRKIENFKQYLKARSDYETTFYELGDGLSVSKKVK